MPSEPMTNEDLRKLLDTAVEAAMKAGALIQERVGKEMNVTFKAQGAYNPVTEMDMASENLVRQIVTERHPGSHFLAEEGGGYAELVELTWVVDPIDGTVNYSRGIPIYCISIAAVEQNAPLVGVVYNPTTNELFTAMKGHGAHLNGRRLHVSTNATLDTAVLVTGFPYNVAENPYHCIDTFVEFVRRGVPVRRLGSAALDLAYVAAGRFEAYWEVSLNAWDVAAGALMILEAGGTVSTYSPEPCDGSLITDRLLASNGLIDAEMREVLMKDYSMV